MQKSSHVNYRANSLTQVLRSCFTDQNACTVVIATVAPCSGDTDHTLGTHSHCTPLLAHTTLITEGECADVWVTGTLGHAILMDGQKENHTDVVTVPVESYASILARQARAAAPKASNPSNPHHHMTSHHMSPALRVTDRFSR